MTVPYGDYTGPKGSGANQPRPMNAPPARELSIGVQPGTPNIIRARTVIIQGAGGGEFIYDAGGNLREAGVGATTTDPLQGLTCPAGRSFWNGFGAILILISDANDATFFYQDLGTAVQGILVAVIATNAGTDPVDGTAYSAGFTNIDPAFADSSNVVGTIIKLNQLSFTANAEVTSIAGSGAVSPAVRVSAPEQGVSGHLVLLMQGTSPDGTHLGQFLVARVPTGFTSPTPVTSSLIEFQSPTTALVDSLLQLITAAGGVAGDNMLGLRVSGDTSNRLRVEASGAMKWGPGNATQDCTLDRQAAGIMELLTCDLDIATVGKGLRIKEGANSKMGTAVLVAGTVTVANTSVTANSRILLCHSVTGGTKGHLSRTIIAGTSFTINSDNAADTSTVLWVMLEPG